MRVDWATLPFPAPFPAPAEDILIQHQLLGLPVPPRCPARWESQHWDDFSPFPGLVEGLTGAEFLQVWEKVLV